MDDRRSARFVGRTAFVSGGARGLGEAFIRGFHREGANVIITDVLEDQGAALAAELGKKAIFVRHDVTSADDWRSAVLAGENAFGSISVLCNNAGIFDAGLIADFPEERYRRVIDINQIGVFLGMQAIVPSMRRAGGGAIVNSSSAAGLVGYAYASAYVASKWAVRGMTKVAALELGGDNIRVNSIHPGIIETAMSGGFRAEMNQPIPRTGGTEEVANLVLFLASDEASYCTGAEFVVDGGQVTAGFTPAGG